MKTQSLFSNSGKDEPLASRVRPRTLSQFIGQNKLVGNDGVLKALIKKDELPSLILWGPPGSGKTTLANIIANETKDDFISVSATNASIKKIKEGIAKAEQNKELGRQTIIFVDEIHRFNKAQQDAFLPYVEDGSIILIGATTENPSFEINSALLSRSKVFVLNQLTTQELVKVEKDALKNPNGLKSVRVKITDKQLTEIAEIANGDARKALNVLEMAVENGKTGKDESTVSDKELAEVAGQKINVYDKDGEEHYNIISALHKSMRNSDVDAAVYWANRMLDGGEDPLYIARRLVRFASEDVGLADTNALNVAVNTFQACQFLGMPECNVHITECVIYLALAPKSTAVYKACLKAEKDIKKRPNAPVPMQIRNAPTKLMKNLGYGKGYQFAPNAKDKITNMKTMPENLEGQRYYYPTDEGREPLFKKRLAGIKEWHDEHDDKK